MKKIICLTLVFIIISSLFIGCNNEKTNNGESTQLIIDNSEINDSNVKNETETAVSSTSANKTITLSKENYEKYFYVNFDAVSTEITEISNVYGGTSYKLEKTIKITITPLIPDMTFNGVKIGFKDKSPDYLHWTISGPMELRLAYDGSGSTTIFAYVTGMEPEPNLPLDVSYVVGTITLSNN
ncbi:MAG: hypothetical protein ACI3XQ_13395 [Eubacteriales bacterium]